MINVAREISLEQVMRRAVAELLEGAPELLRRPQLLDAGRAREALALIREACRENGAALLLVSHDRQVLGGFGTVLELARINRARTGTEVAL